MKKYNQGPRENKIRVWYPNEKKFYYTTIEDISFILGKDAWCEPYVIQLCTGKKDDADKEIYEGDIVDVTFSKCGTMVCTVELKYGEFTYLMLTENPTEPDVIAFPTYIKDKVVSIKVVRSIFV